MGLFNRDKGEKRYKMQEKMFSIGDDAWIEDDDGNKVFRVDGKALRVRRTLVLRDLSGNELASIQEKKVRVRDTMEIERGGRKVATVKKAMIAPLRDRFHIELESGGSWEAKGNILDHEYEVSDGRTDIAKVSKKWLRAVRDTYGIEIAEGYDDALVLAVVITLDEMRRE